MSSIAGTYSKARLHSRSLSASTLPASNIVGKVSNAHLPYVDLLLGVNQEGSPRIQVGCLLWGDHLGDQVGRGSWRLGGNAVEAAPLDGQLAPLLPVEQLQAGNIGCNDRWPGCTTSFQWVSETQATSSLSRDVMGGFGCCWRLTI